jgi:hypothetical protein
MALWDMVRAARKRRLQPKTAEILAVGLHIQVYSASSQPHEEATMSRSCSLIALAMTTSACVSVTSQAGDWISFVDQTESRLIAAGDIGAADSQERDYAWGDVDQDGDSDLIVVRKQPWDAGGARRNVLLMNEGGILVDRTAEFASASDVDGDEGFLTPTNDRDVELADVDNDGWLDIITAVTLSDGQPKHISHPRIYMNLGEDGKGAWLGFRHEDARIPQLADFASKGIPHAPRFNAVAAGDVNADGFADLYFTDTDMGGAETLDFNDRLLVNDGKGFFTDVSADAMTPQMLLSSSGNACAIADMNADGVNDVVKLTCVAPPLYIAVLYNNPAFPGTFNHLDIVYTLSATDMSVGDLNGDGKLDIVATDDGVDRFLLNAGNGGDGLANFTSHVFPNASNGFGGESVIADLDSDGADDVVITDIDFDIPGCNRVTGLYRNDGTTEVPAFLAESAGIPNAQRTGVHDAAVLDVNGDGRLDLVLGRCAGTSIWISLSPADFDGDGSVNAADLAELLAQWGECSNCESCPADLAPQGGGDCTVGPADLAELLANWT